MDEMQLESRVSASCDHLTKQRVKSRRDLLFWVGEGEGGGGGGRKQQGVEPVGGALSNISIATCNTETNPFSFLFFVFFCFYF